MKKDWTYKEFGAIVNFDKRFQGIDKSLQSSIVHFNHVSAEALKELSVPEGNVKLLSTGLFDGTTTEEKAGQNLNDGEVISIPTGGTPNIKYYKGKFVDSGNILCVAKDENICLRYVYYALRGNITQIANNFRGASILHPQMSKIWQIKLPVPPISIQESIVRELDLLHSVISKKKEQLRELDNLAQSLFYQMFGDPITNPMDWEIKKLGEVVAEDCSLSYGIVQPGDHVENGIPVVRPVDLTNTYVFRKGLKCTSKEIANAYKRTVLRGNELLMCVRGTTGVVSIASSELVGCNTTRGITPIALGEEVSLWYVYHLLKMSSFQQLIASLTYGIALKQINMKDVRTLPIILPPLSLQQSFAAKVSAIEAQKQAITQSIHHTEALLAQRMDNYFGI